MQARVVAVISQPSGDSTSSRGSASQHDVLGVRVDAEHPVSERSEPRHVRLGQGHEAALTVRAASRPSSASVAHTTLRRFQALVMLRAKTSTDNSALVKWRSARA
jgi:hypothetical protein